MSEDVFQQDGAPAHRAEDSEAVPNQLRDFWAKNEWPDHSPDLSSIENLCAFVHLSSAEAESEGSSQGTMHRSSDVRRHADEKSPGGTVMHRRRDAG